MSLHKNSPIMVFEPDPVLLKSTLQIIAQKGFRRVFGCSDIRVSQSHLLNYPPAVLLVFNNQDEIAGLELVILGHSKRIQLIVFMSGIPEYAEYLQEYGIVFVRQPCEPEDIWKALE